jgi:hypothetical protein
MLLLNGGSAVEVPFSFIRGYLKLLGSLDFAIITLSHFHFTHGISKLQ